MIIGLGIGIPFIRNYVSSIVFDPSKLFTGNTQGVWYDPSDINLTWRRNLLTYSEQFDNAAWTKSNLNPFGSGSVANTISTTDPLGGNNADFIQEDQTNNQHILLYISSLQSGTYTATVYLKAAGRNFVKLQPVGGGFVFFNLSTGQIGTQSGAVGSISNAGNGWYRCSVTTTYASNYTFIILADSDTGTQSPAYTGNGTSGIYIWGAQLELGSTATPYQRITDGIQDYLQYQAQPVLYRDAAGTLPVTAVEQPVGLMLDKSKGLVLGPELVTNGGFDTNVTGWTLADSAASINWVSGGYANVKMLTNTGSGARQDVALASGWAKVSIRARKVGTSGNIRLVLHGYGAFTTTLGDILITSQSFQNYDFVVPATNGGFRIYLKVEFSGAEMEVDSVSVRELPGNHAFNSSGNSANFPVLSARYNLLTKTEQFDDNGGWEKQNTLVAVANQSIAPDGTISADLLYPGTSGVQRMVRSLAAINYTTRSTYSFYVKSAGFRYIGLFNRIGNAPGVSFDLQLGTKTVYDAGITATITPSTNGFYLCSLTQDSGYTAIYLSDTEGSYTATANGTSGIYVWGADLRVANDALNQPAYQRVNTATDYDTAGFKPYLRFNGTNQWLQTNSVDFTYGDKMFVSAGVRKLSDAVFGVIAELGADTFSNAGTFAIGQRNNGAELGYGSLLNGSQPGGYWPSTYAAPHTAVLSTAFDIGGSLLSDEVKPRVNAAIPSSLPSWTGTNAGTGNFSNRVIYWGARNGGSFFFNGRLYGAVVAGKQASAAEITSTETYLNNKTGAF